MARFFFALDLSPKDKAKIAELQQEVTPALPKPTGLNNLHLTLAFLGNISESNVDNLTKVANQLAKKLTSKNGYQLNADHLGVFAKAQVLFIGLAQTPEWLNSLATEIENAAKSLNIRIDERPYHPHITISRKVKHLPEPIDFNISLSIHSFSLYLSESTEHGVVYSPVKTFNLS